MRLLTRVWLIWVVLVTCWAVAEFGAESWEFLLCILFSLPGSAWCAWYWTKRAKVPSMNAERGET